MTYQINRGRDLRDAFRGCLLGGAIGDALGYAVEFQQWNEIKARYGADGIREYALKGGKAIVSDDTQMTLFTATGLLLGFTRGMVRGIMGSPESYIKMSYETWYHLQRGDASSVRNGRGFSWLADVPEMAASRAPGMTCLSALQSKKEGTIDDPINHSKGCGGVMRVAPVGLFLNRPHEGEQEDRIADVNHVAAGAAALTHGHPLGWLSASALAHIVNRLTYTDMHIADAVLDANDALQTLYGKFKETETMMRLLERALELAERGGNDNANIGKLGEGWVGEEALAIAVYCAARYPNDFSKAVRAAVNHDGDSDSTGSILGNILGAKLGASGIGEAWLTNLECREVIEEIADDLHDFDDISSGRKEPDDGWEQKYMCNRKP